MKTIGFVFLFLTSICCIVPVAGKTISCGFVFNNANLRSLLLFSKVEIETLFLFRERLQKADAHFDVVKSEIEAQLLSSILKRPVLMGESFGLTQFNEKVLFTAFRGLALELARDKHNTHWEVPLEDLQQAALSGLWEAILNYSSSSIYMFSTTAMGPMHEEINRTLKTLRHAVSFSGSDYSLVSRILRIESALRRRLQREPTLDEVHAAHNSKYANMQARRIDGILRWQKIVSLFDTFHSVMPKDNENGETYYQDALDQVPSPAKSPEDLLYFRQVQNRLALALKRHPPELNRAFKVLSLYYGIYTEMADDGLYRISVKEGQTLEMVGTAFAGDSHEKSLEFTRNKVLTRERIRQLLAKAVRYMQIVLPKETDSEDMISLFEALRSLKEES